MEIKNYQLLSHARHFGIARLRESCVVVTVNQYSERKSIVPSAQLLAATSRQQLKVRRGSTQKLLDIANNDMLPANDQALFRNRALDAHDMLFARRKGISYERLIAERRRLAKDGRRRKREDMLQLAQPG